MNRRQLLAGTVSSLGLLLANNRLALARMQGIATPDVADRSKPGIILQDHSHEEALYLGALTTWLELLEDANEVMYDGIDAVTEAPTSPGAMATILMPLGVWKHLALDVYAGIDNALGAKYNNFLALNAFDESYYNPGADTNYFGGISLKYDLNKL